MKTFTDDTVEIPREKPVFVDPSGRRRRIVRRVSIAACILVSGYAVLLMASLLGAPIPASALLPVPDPPATAPALPATPAPNGGPSIADDTTTADSTEPPAPAEEPATAPQAQAPAVTTAASPPLSSAEETRNSRARPSPPGRGQDGRPEPGR